MHILCFSYQELTPTLLSLALLASRHKLILPHFQWATCIFFKHCITIIRSPKSKLCWCQHTLPFRERFPLVFVISSLACSVCCQTANPASSSKEIKLQIQAKKSAASALPPHEWQIHRSIGHERRWEEHIFTVFSYFMEEAGTWLAVSGRLSCAMCCWAGCSKGQLLYQNIAGVIKTR